MARLVRCPKCKKILTEYAEIPVYQCGGCATILRAKYYNAPGEDNSGSLQNNNQESLSEHGFSDNGSTSMKETIPSSSCSLSLKVDHEGGTAAHIANSPELDEDGELAETHKNLGEKGDLSTSQPFEVSPASKENSLNEQVDESPKIDEVVSDSLKLTKEGDRLSDSIGTGIASEEDIVDRKQNDGFDDILKSSTTISSNAYEGSISSSDDGHRDHTRDRYVPKSRRTFRNRVDQIKGKEKEEDNLGHGKRSEIQVRSLSSESSDEPNDSDVLKIFNELKKEISSKYESGGLGMSFDSTEFQSARNWMESEKDGLSRSLTKGTAFSSDWHNQEELLRKIDELREVLAKFVMRKDSKGSDTRSLHDMQHVDQQPNAHLFHYSRKSSYAQVNTATEQHHLWPIPFLGPTPCSCLHCQEERQKQFRFNASDVSSGSSLAGNLYGSEKAPLKEKPKRHCRPVSGAAPFVICYNCMKLLQLPADFLVSRRKLHKLQCGACTEVLMLSFPGKSHSVPQSPSEVVHSPIEIGNGRGNNATISEEKGKGSPRLHNLMGYDSARLLLYNHSDIDEEYDSSELQVLQSRKPSNGGPIIDEFQGSGTNVPRE